MLYDPKWEVKTKAPSLAGFIAWLEKQPLDKTYDWWDVHGCIVCQYLDATLGVNREPMLLREVFNSHEQYHAVAGASPHTFGAALKRAKAEL